MFLANLQIKSGIGIFQKILRTLQYELTYINYRLSYP